MPTYDYRCSTCGPFRDNYPMSRFADPQACPSCEALAPRALAVPAFGGGAQDNTPTPFPASHAGGCACCAAPRRLTAEAV